jgi:hypothetical protein
VNSALACDPLKRRMKSWRITGPSARFRDSASSSALLRLPEAMAWRAEVRSLRSDVMVLLYSPGLPQSA